MSLSHPTQFARHDASSRPTRHPMVCLVAGFGFMVAVCVGVHYAFTALL